jgi:hypothetical protein
MPKMFKSSNSFFEKLTKFVNSDHIAIRTKIKVTLEQVSDTMEHLDLKLKHGRTQVSDVFYLCSEIAAELGSRAGSCMDRKMCDVLKNVIDRNCDMLVRS